jgi:L-tyrosine isonitrile synthase
MASGVAYDDSVAALSFAQEFGSKSAISNPDRSSFNNYKLLNGSPPASKSPAKAEREVGASAEGVLRAFNTWAFKREQPSDTQLMLRAIADAVAAREAVHFVLYWGKGPRCWAGEPELQCLDFLSVLASRVAGVYAPGAAMTLILTDTHAELNGHGRQDTQRYFDEVKKLAEHRGFDTCLLGQLVKSSGIAAAPAAEASASAEILDKLIVSAQKWYRGSATVQEGALTYLRMNLVEQRAVERAFPGSIFVTFNGSELRTLFPRQLPIFYMYSLRRGVSVKPWFLPAERMNPESKDNPSEPAAS